MSDFRAVGAVTAVLRSVLDAAAKAAVDGAEATAERPDRIQDGESHARVNVFLYQVTPNGSWRNQDLPTRRPDGTLSGRPRAALDLHYLLTFFGTEPQQVPQRLLGKVVTTLHRQPLFSREVVERAFAEALDGDPTSYLADSDLANAPERIRFAPVPLNLEELSKLWSIFFQVPYCLSVAYLASVVLLEPETSPRPSLPVAARGLHVSPFRQPEIDEAAPRTGSRAPVLAGTVLVLRGRRLRGEDTVVRFGGAEVAPEMVTDREITVRLASPPVPAGALRAGVLALQVVHRLLLGSPPVPHRGAESNAVPVVLRPAIAEEPGGGPALVLEEVPDDPAAGEPTLVPVLTATLEPPVGATQRVTLLLNGGGRDYSIPARSRSADDDPVRFPVGQVEPGGYLVRVQVDGAESLLEPDPAGGFLGPSVEIGP